MPRKLGPKLILSLTVLIVAISIVSGYLNFRTQKRQLVETMILGADQLSRSITSATWHAMLDDDQDVKRFAQSTLTTTSEEYDAFYEAAWQTKPNTAQVYSFIAGVKLARSGVGINLANFNLGDVVHMINEDQDLNVVAVATVSFRQITGEKAIKMFDFSAVNKWCASHEPQCKPSSPSQK